MSEAELTSDRRFVALLLGAFALVTVLAGLDLTLDLREGTTALHALVETGVVLVGLAGAASARPYARRDTAGRARARARPRAYATRGSALARRG